MADREKVLMGLTCCANLDAWSERVCHKCPYNCDGDGNGGCEDHLIADAFALLREQEARVLSWEEVDKSGNLYVWTEIHSFYSGRGCLIYCTVVRSEFFDELFRLREDSGQEWTRTEEDYNRDNYQGAHSGWRCWSARPTEEQRKAVAWDG